MSLVPGNYVVTVVEHGLVKQNGKVVATLMFSNGAKWNGYFTGGAGAVTTKNLVIAGFNGTKLEQLNIDGAIDKTRKVEIVMQDETWTNAEGVEKTSCKVRFINRVAEKLSDKDLAVTLGGMGAELDAHLAAAREELGVKGVAVVKSSPLQVGADITADDLPF